MKISPHSKYYPPLLIVIIGLFFMILEIRYPFYFLQDDNRSYALPMFVQNYRSIIEDGELAFFNFHQFLGTPHLSTGISAVFYIPLYLALFMSDLLFQNYLAAIDMVVIFQLIFASLGIFYLLRYIGLDDRVAFFGGLTWPLTSFIVYLSNSWFWVSGAAFYFPWILLFSLKVLQEAFSYKNFIILSLLRALLFFVGYAQIFIYVVLFEILTVFLLSACRMKIFRSPWRAVSQGLKYSIASHIFTLAVILPIVLPVVHQMNISNLRQAPLSWQEYTMNSYDLISWVAGVLYPFSSSSSIFTNAQDFLRVNMPYISHIGYAALFFLLFLIWHVWKNKKLILKNRISLFIFIFVILFVIAALWSMNDIFQLFMYGIPIFNRFRWPVKLQFFASFYLVALATIGFSFFLQTKQRSNIFLIIFTFAVLLNFSYLYFFNPRRSLYLFPSEMAIYEPPPFAAMNDGRILSVDKAGDPNKQANISTVYFGENYATFWDIYHFAGYEPFLSKQNAKTTLGLNHLKFYTSSLEDFDLDYFRNWGVKWYILAGNENSYDAFFTTNNIQKVQENAYRIIYFDPSARPFVFWADDFSGEDIQYDIRTNSIHIITSDAERRKLVVNFLYNPFFTGKVNGAEVTIQPDQIGRMVLEVPPGKNEITVRYSDPLFSSAMHISGTVIVGIFLSVHFFNKKLGRAVSI